MFQKIEDCGFRSLYHQLLLLIEDANCLKAASMSFPHKDGDNALLLYGYVDPEAGMSFEVLCMAWYDEEKGFSLRKTPKSTILKLRNDAIRGRLTPVGNADVWAMFLPRILEINKNYRPSAAVQQFREVWLIDELRHPQFPDDIFAALPPEREGEEPEGLWAHLEDTEDENTIATLLNEPYRDCGLHRGDRVELRYRAMGDHVIAEIKNPKIFFQF